MGLLGAESGLVTITGLLWDCDVSPSTERGGVANKGMRRTRGRWRWGGRTTGGLTKKTCRDAPQMAAESGSLNVNGDVLEGYKLDLCLP